MYIIVISYIKFNSLRKKVDNVSPVINIRKSIFACLSSIPNIISLSRQEQVSLTRLRFETNFSHHGDD